MDKPLDLLLIARYKETGSLDVLSELYGQYIHLVYGVCLKYLKDRESSKDAVSQIFEKLVVELMKHEVNNFKSWLHVMTRNYCLMQLRTDKNKGNAENISISDMEYALPLHHEDEKDKEIEYAQLDKCLEQLSQEQRMCVEAFFYQEKSYAEVSESSGFDLKKVKSYIQNGKRNLKQCMERNAN